MSKRDVTDLMDFNFPDDEVMPLTGCLCGAKWPAWSGPYISIYEDTPYACPECGRKFYWQARYTIWEVVDDL